MKYSIIFYGTLVILGIVFLVLVLVGAYFNYYKASILSFLSGMALSNFGLDFVLGGVVFLTTGIVGIGRQCFKNRRKLFTVLAILFVPPLIFATFVVGYAFAISSSPTPPLRSEITQVTVVDNSPLILSVDVKAITSRDCVVYGANLMDSNDDCVVAHCSVKEFCELPAGSTRTLTLYFNDTFPSGNYIIRLYGSWHDSHGSSPFTIPSIV